MCAGIVNCDIVTDVNLRQHPVNGKFVVVLTQRTGHVILMIAGFVLLAQYGDVMVRTIHGRTHQVHSAGIHTDVFLVCMLFMNCFCNKAAVRCKHETSEFRINCNISHAIWCQHFIINLVNAFTDNSNIIFFLIRLVCNADTA